MIVQAMVYVAIFISVFIILGLVPIVFNVQLPELPIGLDAALAILPFGTRIYVLVIGIVTPLLYAGSYVGIGVTRRQFTLGLMVSGLGLCLAFATLFTLFEGFTAGFSLARALLQFAGLCLCFLAGWIAVVGFQIRMRPLTIAPFLFCAWVLMFGQVVFLDQLNIPDALHAGIAAILAVGASVLLLAANRRITFNG
jgi:hypothetical protein